MFRQKTIKSGSTASASWKNKKAKGEIQKITQNLSRIAKKVDAAEEKDNPEEEKRHQEEGEVKEGGFHPETPHKAASGHLKQDAVERGIITKQD